MIPHYICKCKCGNNEYTAWHPFWGTKNICRDCRMNMVKKHKGLLDNIKANMPKCNLINKEV